MAEHLGRKNPDAPGRFHRGCMQGLLQFLDVHHRLRMRKMLTYKRQGDECRAARCKSPKTKRKFPSTGDEHDRLEKDANFMMEGKVNTISRSPRKALMKALVFKRKPREKDQKRKISPLASRLLRTISIHRLECNDYVLPDELSSGSETLTPEVKSHEIVSPLCNQHATTLARTSTVPFSRRQCDVCGSIDAINDVGHNQLHDLGLYLLEKQSLLKQKLDEAKEAFLQHKSTDAKEPGRDVTLDQSKEFFEMMELLNENRELVLQILQDPVFILANYLRGQQASSSDRLLTQSGSCPQAGSSGRNHALLGFNHRSRQSESFNVRDWKSQTGNSSLTPRTTEDGEQAVESMADGESIGTVPSFGVLSDFPCELKNQKSSRTAASRFKAIKRKIKGVIKENKKEHHRISMDGILHKIPYGQNVPGNMKEEIHELWEESTSAKLDRSSSRSKFWRKGAVSSTSKHPPRSMRKSCSVTESLDKYSQLFESISRRESKSSPERHKLAQDDSELQGKKSPPKALGRIFSLPELRSYSLSKYVQSEVSSADPSPSLPISGLTTGNTTFEPDKSQLKPVSTLVCTEECMESDALIEPPSEANASRAIYEGIEQPELIIEKDQSETCDDQDDMTAQDSGYGFPYADPSDLPTKPCPTSTTGTYVEKEPVTPAKNSVSEGSELEPGQTHIEELGFLTDPQWQSDLDAYSGAEGLEANFDSETAWNKLNDFDSIHVHVDEKDEAEFQYVRDILRKSGFSGVEFLRGWYSPDQPVDPLLFEEAECSSNELDDAGEPEMTLNHMLLFDLINEVLMDIYDTSFAYCSWLSRFDSRVRPMPVGCHVLEEVWANISWHLNSQLQQDQSVENVVARDFMKNDGWMNLQHDSEYVGLELEDLILDDLLDEVILQFDDL